MTQISKKNISLQLSDTECRMLDEIFQVFLRYQNQVREFGIQLVHSHFTINENEVLLETNNKKTRTLQVTTVSKDQLSMDTIATAWQFDNAGQLQVAMFCCEPSGGGDGGGDGGGSTPPH
ncbi:MAG: hypothetical protein EOO46_01255 [Flavobacterium sp.]|nr:MAG: hypothetical protein EOO46_01255 [Flavobacterium sp.]